MHTIFKVRSHTALLTIVFFLSGFAGLVYQVAWQRILTLYYGVGSVSIALIVSIYMVGLGAGALFGGAAAEKTAKRTFLFFVLQLATGAFGLASIRILQWLGSATAGGSYVSSLFWMSLFLATPTVLMGATLPVLTKIFNGLIEDFVRTVSFLYFINTLGAAAGALAAAYVLISFGGLDIAVYSAAGINFLVALVVGTGLLPSDASIDIQVPSSRTLRMETLPAGLFCPLVLAAGFLAIGYEIIWFRVTEVLVKASPYSFASVLSVYLLGIALGSHAMGRWLRDGKRIPGKNLFFILQFAIGTGVAASIAGYYHLTRYTAFQALTARSFACEVHPPLKNRLLTLAADPWCAVDIFFWPLVFVMVPAFLMGACFPVVSSLGLKDPGREGRAVGNVLFLVVAGNALGGPATAFWLLPRLGTEGVLLLFSSAGMLFGLLADATGNRRGALTGKAPLVAVILLANLMLFPRRGQLYECLHTPPPGQSEIFLLEGTDGVVVTYEGGSRLSNFINGLRHGSRPGTLFHYEAVEAASFAPKAEDVLIIGFGAGSTTEAVLKMAEVRRVTVVEISRTLMRGLRQLPLFQRILGDNRLSLVIDDGRRFLQRTSQRYDLILADPSRATTSYSNNLCSREFLELARSRLKREGVFLLGIYEHDESINRVMRKTIASVFGHMRAYRFFCLASDGPLEANQARRAELISAYPPDIRSDLAATVMIDISTGQAVNPEDPNPQPVYLGDQEYVRESTIGYPINTDLRPACEYYLGLR